MSYNGLLISFVGEPEFSASLRKRIASRSYFTHGVSRHDLNPAAREIVILSFGENLLNYICFAVGTRAAETSRMQMRFTRFFDLRGLNINEFVNDLELIRELKIALNRPASRLNEAAWGRLLVDLIRLRPDARRFLDELESLRTLPKPAAADSVLEIVAQEKDATRLALEIFGLDQAKIKEAVVVENNDVAPFLQKLKQATLLEDAMIHHDSELLPGFNRLRRHVQGAVEFQKGSEKITILNVNRAPVERALGVDLVYYNHRFRSYLMVQYKRLNQRLKGWSFNCRDPQFLADVDRIRAFKSSEKATADLCPLGYRFNTECFFFKFCNRISYDPLSTDFIEGFYLPFEFTESVMNSSQQKQLNEANCIRSLNNTQFVNLMRHAWLGSRNETTDALTRIIEEASEVGRSVIVGVSREG